MSLPEHTTIQFPYYGDDIVVFLFKDGSKPRILSLGFNAEFRSLKELAQEWYDYAQFFEEKEKGNDT